MATKKHTKKKRLTKPRRTVKRFLRTTKFIPTLAAPVDGELILSATRGLCWRRSATGEELLITAEQSLCGAGILSTGKNDPFLEACIIHDHMYVQRAYMEANGWNRATIDEFFLVVMLEIAGDNLLLQARANAYYSIVRSAGWVYYYRH